MGTNNIERNYSAIVYALSLTRGQLYQAIFGDLSLEDAEQVLNGTTFENIAAVLQCSVEDIEIEWDDYLTEMEKHLISGKET